MSADGHTLVIRHKIGEETGTRLRMAACSCGWQAGCWYVSDQFVSESYSRHVRAVVECSDVPWMLAPEAGK